MGKILNIETAATTCSISIGIDGELMALCECFELRSHSSKINLLVKKALNDAGLKTFEELDAVSVSKGPGSYTGLRIGVSTAKGFSYALGIPLIGIETLQSLALSGIKLAATKIIDFSKNKMDFLFCPMIDARRMEVYAAIYNSNLNEVRKVNADIVDDTTYNDFLNNNKVIFIGDGVEKCKTILEKSVNAYFVDEVYPSSREMVVLSEQSFKNRLFEDVAYFEPYYLKDFIAGISKK